MQAEEFVREARSTQPELPPLHLLQLVACQEEPLPHTEESSDQHALFRALVLEELQKALSSGDRALIVIYPKKLATSQKMCHVAM
jgi:hypothetical protein